VSQAVQLQQQGAQVPVVPVPVVLAQLERLLVRQLLALPQRVA
jgi:hypothetical protein